MSRVAVTGGAGFLGSHIVRRLLDDGHEVSIVDDFSSGSLQNLDRPRESSASASWATSRDYRFAEGPLEGAETVFHFAAEVGSVSYLHGSNAQELAALQSNLVIDANVFKACLENRVKTVIYASSVSVYPFDEQLGSHIQFKEEDSERKVNPEGGYGWSKYIAEKQLALMPGVSYGVARIFHAYGKNIYLRPDRSQVIASLIRKAVRYPEEDFVVWGDGSQRRCFVYIDDAIDALMRLEKHVGRAGEPHRQRGVDGGDDRPGARRTGRGSCPRRTSRSSSTTQSPPGALNRTPDLARAKRVLGWSPTTPLLRGPREDVRLGQGKAEEAEGASLTVVERREKHPRSDLTH